MCDPVAIFQVVEGNPCLKYIQLIVLPWSGTLTVHFKKDSDAVKCATCEQFSE